MHAHVSDLTLIAQISKSRNQPCNNTFTFTQIIIKKKNNKENIYLHRSSLSSGLFFSLASCLFFCLGSVLLRGDVLQTGVSAYHQTNAHTWLPIRPVGQVQIFIFHSPFHSHNKRVSEPTHTHLVTIRWQLIRFFCDAWGRQHNK